jgi:hypothetical protein
MNCELGVLDQARLRSLAKARGLDGRFRVVGCGAFRLDIDGGLGRSLFAIFKFPFLLQDGQLGEWIAGDPGVNGDVGRRRS